MLPTLGVIPTLGPAELVIILVILIVIFGAGRITDIGGALGKSIKEFRKATKEEDKETAPGESSEESKASEAKKD